ncbi:MAG: proteasome accessory factor PafA2 family protein [bacterium]|nr:proteasome accessory factor PafA2 family protein [bacterium]
MNNTKTTDPKPVLLPKVIGCDTELGNFITGIERNGGTAREASRALLSEFTGILEAQQRPVGESYSWSSRGEFWGSGGYTVMPDSAATRPIGYNPYDIGRKYLADNGGCVYIDLDHLELCTPEVTGAFEFVACWHGMLRKTRDALNAANHRQPHGRRIHVLVNNSDGLGHSYGSHLNFLITESCRQRIFERKMQYLLYLAAYQVSSIIFTGQGKVGSENRQPHVAFQISQRADFFEQLVGMQTTYNRPIVNSRDEAHCGPGVGGNDNDTEVSKMARLHVIFYDNTLCHVSTLLKVGVMQIMLSMIEAEWMNNDLILEDPLRALAKWSHDPTLRARATLWSRSRVTAIEHQMGFLEEARRFVDQGRCDGIVPNAREIVSLWSDTLMKLQARDWVALSRRLDWVLKQSLLERAIERHPEFDWRHASIRRLDHLYSSLDFDEGLFWAYESNDSVERLVSDEEIDRLANDPPEATRAWTRARLLRQAGSDRVNDVGWDFVELKSGFGWRQKIELSNPLAFTRDECKSAFDPERTLEETVDVLRTLTRTL